MSEPCEVAKPQRPFWARAAFVTPLLLAFIALGLGWTFVDDRLFFPWMATVVVLGWICRYFMFNHVGALQEHLSAGHEERLRAKGAVLVPAEPSASVRPSGFKVWRLVIVWNLVFLIAIVVVPEPFTIWAALFVFAAMATHVYRYAFPRRFVVAPPLITEAQAGVDSGDRKDPV